MSRVFHPSCRSGHQFALVGKPQRIIRNFLFLGIEFGEVLEPPKRVNGEDNSRMVFRDVLLEDNLQNFLICFHQNGQYFHDLVTSSCPCRKTTAIHQKFLVSWHRIWGGI
jgi:hypothetical protein